MTRFATNTFAAVVAVFIAATSISAVTNVPPQPTFVAVSAPLVA